MSVTCNRCGCSNISFYCPNCEPEKIALDVAKKQLADKDAEIARLKEEVFKYKKSACEWCTKANRLQSSLAEARKLLTEWKDGYGINELEAVFDRTDAFLKGTDGQEKVL